MAGRRIKRPTHSRESPGTGEVSTAKAAAGAGGWRPRHEPRSGAEAGTTQVNTWTALCPQPALRLAHSNYYDSYRPGRRERKSFLDEDDLLEEGRVMQSCWEEGPWIEDGFHRDRIEETQKNRAQFTRHQGGQDLGSHLPITTSR